LNHVKAQTVKQRKQQKLGGANLVRIFSKSKHISLQFPLAVQILWSLSLISFLVAGVFIRAGRTPRVPWAKNDENAISTLPISPSGSDCRVRGLAAVTHDGKPLLQDVDLKLRLGTVTTICGQFGSGKSILLKALSQQRLRGISVSIEEGEAQLKTLQKPFLRQRDDSEMGEALSWLDSKGLDLDDDMTPVESFDKMGVVSLGARSAGKRERDRSHAFNWLRQGSDSDEDSPFSQLDQLL
jgi:hypothetical protein